MKALRAIPARAPRPRFLQRLILAIALAAPAAGIAHAAAADRIGVNLPMLTSPFWQAYNGYVLQFAKQLEADILAPVNSNQDPAQQITDVSNLLNLGAKGLVVAPLDSAAISRALELAEQKNVPVVAVDVAERLGLTDAFLIASGASERTTGSAFHGERFTAGR